MKVRYYFFIGVVFLSAMATLSCSSSIDKPQSTIHESISGHEQVADKMHDIVNDKKRADKAVSLAQEMFKETEDFLTHVIESRDKAIELSENYDTTRGAFDTHYDVFFQQRKEHSEKYTALSFQLRKVVTEDEWNKINEVLAKEMQLLSAEKAERG